MRRMFCLAALLVLYGGTYTVAAVPGGSGGDSPFPLLVTTAWLGEHVNDPAVIVLHIASNRREYTKGHIPGARFLWNQALAESNEDYTLELPSLAKADSVLRSLGVSEGKRIVLYYAGGNVTPATRVFTTLDYLGFRGRVSVLDGGLDAWKAGGRPVATDNPAGIHGDWKTRSEPGVVVDADWVAGHLGDSTVSIVDARALQFYEGRGGGMPRAGHIPGAVNIPFSSLVDSTNRFKSPDSLRAMFRASGISQGKTVVSYCHIGQQATLVYFVARYLGYPARLYDGSFEDWSGRDNLPVVNPSDPKVTPNK